MLAHVAGWCVQGTEVKAITYSNMQILASDDKSRWDLYVIIDI